MQNEPIRSYAVGDPDRESLKSKLKELASTPIYYAPKGLDLESGPKREIHMPHSHKEILGTYSYVSEKGLDQARDRILKNKSEWASRKPEERIAIFERAAELLAGPWRNTLNGATMLGQSKNVYQAEIDSACELIDFFRFNAKFYRELLAIQPLSVPGITNTLDYRPLDGFVAAITPFNFTAIAGNLPSTPAMMGNVVLWKPSDTQMFSAYYTLKLLEEAGLPEGIIELVPADGPKFGKWLVGQRDLGGIHFTGSTQTFQWLWSEVGQRIKTYASYPRIVGETGGKDFVFVHPSADLDVTAVALIRGAYEYQGQKCSAASRAYIPESMWPKLKTRLIDDIRSIKMGDVRDFSNFMGAVIDERSFDKSSRYQNLAKESPECKILAGGGGSKEVGYFIEPTLIETTNPKFTTMCEEIFGPILTVWVYKDAELDQAVKLCAETSPYALTGAILSQDKAALEKLSQALRFAAGNLYINDKPTGAVVGQQPFGGSRASGTNDKAGSILNIVRWASPRTIKTNLEPPKTYPYPHMAKE